MARKLGFFCTLILLAGCSTPISYNIDNKEHGNSAHICVRDCPDKRWEGYPHGHREHYCVRRCIWYVR